LSSHVSPSRFQKRWSAENAHEDSASLEVKTYADWLAGWFASNVGITDTSVKHGSTKLINWFIHDDSALAGREIRSPALSGATERLLSISPGTLDEVYEKAIWKYPQEAATNWPAKATVSSLRQRAADLADEASASVAWNKRAFSKMQPVASPGATAEEIGNAHHQFLQLVSLNRTGNAKQLTEEVKRLVKEGALSAEQSHLLNLKMLARFWGSALGRRICEQAQFVKRELPFTARFSPAELSAITGESVASNMQQEFVVVQGVADLVVLLPEALWLLDFKTDRLEENQIPERAEHYAPQLRLYSSALSKIYKRPATGSWLYFLSPGKAVEIGSAATSLK
jgi:ATP-dependent helicase/nuclease subunit A